MLTHLLLLLPCQKISCSIRPTFLSLREIGEVFARINQASRNAKRPIILDQLASRKEISIKEFKAAKEALGKKKIAPELMAYTLPPPVASIVTNLMGSDEDDLELSFCQNLRKLDCTDVTPEEFCKLIPELPSSLTELVRRDGRREYPYQAVLNNVDLKALLTQCPLLETLTLEAFTLQNELANDQTMNILAEHRAFRNIVLPRCPNVTNAGLRNVLEKNILLEQIDLEGNHWMDDETMGILAEARSVRNLNLRRCQNITNTGLENLLARNQQLFQLILWNNSWVDDETMPILAAHPGLRYIDLRDLDNVTNEGFKILLERNQQLTKLALSYNRWIDDDSLKLLAKSSVKEIDLYCCRNISNQALAELRRVRPDMIITGH